VLAEELPCLEALVLSQFLEEHLEAAVSSAAASLRSLRHLALELGVPRSHTRQPASAPMRLPSLLPALALCASTLETLAIAHEIEVDVSDERSVRWELKGRLELPALTHLRLSVPIARFLAAPALSQLRLTTEAAADHLFDSTLLDTPPASKLFPKVTSLTLQRPPTPKWLWLRVMRVHRHESRALDVVTHWAASLTQLELPLPDDPAVAAASLRLLLLSLPRLRELRCSTAEEHAVTVQFRERLAAATESLDRAHTDDDSAASDPFRRVRAVAELRLLRCSAPLAEGVFRGLSLPRVSDLHITTKVSQQLVCSCLLQLLRFARLLLLYACCLPCLMIGFARFCRAAVATESSGVTAKQRWRSCCGAFATRSSDVIGCQAAKSVTHSDSCGT
jgi:hypothetical protein